MNTTQQSTARRIALVAALPVIGVLALAGCSSNDTTAATGSASTSVSTPASSSSPGTAAGSGLVAAGRSALDAVGTGTVTAVEQEAGGSSWEVRVAGADGAEQEVHTDAAGTSVTAGPTATSSDPDDLAENTRFVDAASLSWSEAASAMTGAVAGTVTELGLDDHAGAVVWEGDVVDAGNTTHSIRIDARTGDVVTNTVDTDSDD